MATKKIFECQACGAKTPKWAGKCTSCGAWDSFLEVKLTEISKVSLTNSENHALSVTEISEDEAQKIPTNESEFDAVLGGGCVAGSLVLVGGSPGVGKSTLLLKIASNMSRLSPVLYVSAEESLGQIKQRADRIGANSKDLYLFSEIILEKIEEEFQKRPYKVLVIDSIQTIYKEELDSAAGSISQVREITFNLMRLAKNSLASVFIIGHITKDGAIAGPRVLEHMVDTVLYFEGDSSKEIRILRTFKNRFGSTSEIGIFEMNKKGLISATAANARFFNKSRKSPGSAITVVLEGARAIVLEVQALVCDSVQNPRRSATGFDSNRLNMLLALLEKKLELPFNRLDVFVNVTGGIKITETGADLAIIAAILSSFKNRLISQETIFLGEVSLTGDIREIHGLDTRLKEAHLQGFKKAILAKEPINQTPIKCFAIEETSKILDLM